MVVKAEPVLDRDAVRERMCVNEWFRHLPSDFQDALLTHGRPRQLAAGEYLFEREDAGDALYCVLEGSISVQTSDLAGEAPVLVLLTPCNWFGELSLLDGRLRTHDAVADTAALVWRVAQQPMKAWLDAHPQGWRDIACLLAGKLRVAFQVFDGEMRSAMTVRVARRLRIVSLGWGWRSEPGRRVQLSQEQLARMLGTSRSSVNKSLRELQQRGVLRLHYGAIEITDPARLAAACGPAPAARSA